MSAQTFTVEKPAVSLAVTSISPTKVTAGTVVQALTLSVSGTGLDLAGLKVTWDGVSLSTTPVSSTLLRASIPADYLATPGTHSVSILLPGVGVLAGFGAQTFDVQDQSLSPSRPPLTAGLSNVGKYLVYGLGIFALLGLFKKGRR